MSNPVDRAHASAHQRRCLAASGWPWSLAVGINVCTVVTTLAGCRQAADSQPSTAARSPAPAPVADPASTPADSDAIQRTTADNQGQASAANQEHHLANLQQLTFGGENAEAYFSFAEDRLIYQSTVGDMKCDQIFTMTVAGSERRMVSTGKGRTTCGYFLPGDQKLIYASTHGAASDCLPPPDRSHGYVWKLYPEFDIFSANPDGSDAQALIAGPGYDAEATVSPAGDRIVFTSTRSGDPEIYSAAIDGSDIRRLTNEIGYDGGPFFSWDGQWIVFRANHPQTADEKAKYQAIIRDQLVYPTRLEIFVMRADGSERTQVTNNGAANFAPFFHPDGKRIIFSSNQHDPRGRDFDLYIVGRDGTDLTRVTFNDTFDGFPMFNRKGNKLVFASNRGNAKRGETNIFIADWRETSP